MKNKSYSLSIGERKGNSPNWDLDPGVIRMKRSLVRNSRRKFLCHGFLTIGEEVKKSCASRRRLERRATDGESPVGESRWSSQFLMVRAIDPFS